jgi:hypothetical protein
LIALTEFTGFGNPSTGGTTLIIGTLASTPRFSPPSASTRSAARVFVNAEFNAGAEGSQGVVLHYNPTTGACSLGAIDIQSGVAFIATRTSSDSPFVVLGSQPVPGYVRGQTYDVLLTSGDTRMVLHVYSRGTQIVRIPADGLTLTPGVTGVAMLASAGQTTSLRGSFRTMTGHKTVSLDTAGDGVSDLLWLRTGLPVRSSVIWDLGIGEGGATRIRSTVSISEPSSGERFQSGSRLVSVGEHETERPAFEYQLMAFSVDEGASTRLLNGSVGGSLIFQSGWFVVRANREWDSLVRDAFRFEKGEWSLRTMSDFDRNGVRDQLWHNRFSGEVSVMLQRVVATAVPIASYLGTGELSTQRVALPNVGDANWRILGAGDIDDDGFSDILWHNQETGVVVAWYLDALRLKRWAPIDTLPAGWSFVGIGSYDAQAGNDIMWRNDASGLVGFWSLTAGAVTGWREVAFLPDANWIGGG